MCISRRQRGLTLIELIVFILIVSVALVGVMTVLNVTARSSADPMVRKQMLTVAEAILEEVQLQPFTFCAPEDANVAIANNATTGAGGCATTVQGLGAGGAARIANTDNVGDYASVTLNPVNSVDGTYSLADYTAAITVTPENLGPAASQISSSACASATDCTTLNVLRIAVTVSHIGADNITVEGYRTRHSPNALP
ncbi:MAG: prepilin-type N-terminal cleavage/methylation domain-containing protein [Sulfuritalea sp.]|nr:prepilin-type N-terminal cleavage/methylation domain-containing protein [Sulfuritalea sp.]